MNLDNGNVFVVTAKNQSQENVYVQKVELNGKVVDKPFIEHRDVMNGGELIFYISKEPNDQLYSKI